MKGYYDNEGYYRKLIELQEKLRRSEEERMKLEEKFNKMIQHKREEEQIELQRLKRQYSKFLEEDKFRSERNDQIIQALDRIEYKAAMLTAKTDRLRILRGQYETCIKRSLIWNSNNNNNVKLTVQQLPRDIAYEDTQQLRPTSLNIGKANPFPTKFNYPSASNDGATGNSAQYPNLDISNEQNINKPTSMSYFHKQNMPINYVTSNFDNKYGSKISSRFTPNVVQENSGTIRGNLSIRNPLNQFSENGCPQTDGRVTSNENANTSYPSIYNHKNDTTNPSYKMEKTQLRTEISDPHRETWTKCDNEINVHLESSNQSLPRKVDFASTIPKTNHDIQQLSPKLTNPKLDEFNTENISGSYSPTSDNDKKINSDMENKIKQTTCYIVDDKHNDAEDVRILNNAYDGYYVDDESEQIYEEPKNQKEPEQPSQTMAPSSILDKQIKNEITTSSLHANQISNIQTHDYQKSRPQEIIDEKCSNTSIEPTENMNQLTKHNILATDTSSAKPLTNQGYETSKTSENREQTLTEISMNNDVKPSLEYTNVNPESTVYSENSNNESNNYDDQQRNNIQGEFEQAESNNYENGNINFETHDPETINQTKAEEYANDNETLIAESVENPNKTEIQEIYEPDVNADIGQSQEGYANYEPEVSDTTQAQDVYENYEPGVNINQMSEVYGNYDASQDAIGQDTTLQYEGYDNTQSQFDPNNPDGYDNTQQFDPNNPDGYDNTQPFDPNNPDGYDNTQQYDPNNPDGYDNTQQQFDPNNPEVYGNNQEQYDTNNPGSYENTQQFDPNNPEAYDNNQEQYHVNNPETYDNSQEQYDTNKAYDNTQQQFDPNNPEVYVNNQEQYDTNNAIYNETNQINMEPSQMYNEASVVGDNTSTVQYTDDNQIYYTENQEYLQGGVYDPNVAQENGNYQNIPQDGAYQQDGNEYSITNMPQDTAYQDNMYSEEGQMNYTVESNNIQDQEIVEQENYLMNDSNQPQINLQNEPSVEKLTSNLSTLLDSDTSEQQSSDQQQVASVRDESDFDFSESAAT